MVVVKEVVTARDLRKFISFPNKLYAGNKYWVPPLRMDEMNTLRKDRNPAFEYCEARYWLAYKDGRPAGRIAGLINNRYVERWGKRHVRFGWFDFIDDEEVSAALLGKVEDWARRIGFDAVHGPLGFTDLDREGMLIEGFDEVGTLATNYNYPYYPRHMERLGYGKDVDWVEFRLSVGEGVPEKVDRIAQIALKRSKLTLLNAKSSRDFRPYAKDVFYLINEAYKDLYGVVTLTEKQIEVYIKQYFGFINPDYTKIVLDEDGKLAAFGIAMPSLSKALQKSGGRLFPFGFIHLLGALKKVEGIDLYLVAVRPDLQGRGVNALLLTEIHKACARNGVQWAESNPELEENEKVQAQWKHYEARQHKRRRCFIKHLEEPAGASAAAGR